MIAYIDQIAQNDGKAVTLRGWLHNRRSSGKIHFLQMRDGSGFIQAVLSKAAVGEEVFKQADHISQETAIVVTGVARDTVQGHRYVVYGSSDDAVGYENFPAAQYQPSTTDRDRGYHVQTFGGKYAFDFSPRVRFSSAYQMLTPNYNLLLSGKIQNYELTLVQPASQNEMWVKPV